MAKNEGIVTIGADDGDLLTVYPSDGSNPLMIELECSDESSAMFLDVDQRRRLASILMEGIDG